MYGKIAVLVATGALAAACAQQGGYGYNNDPRTQRAVTGGAIGAAGGAALGAAIADDDLEGALVGGALGAAVGAGIGAATTPTNRTAPNGGTMYYDQRADRYFYVDERTGRTYWENGQLRSY